MNRLKASSSEGKKSTSYAPRNETRDKCRISQWPENTGSHPSSEFPRESRNKLLPTQKIYLKQRGWNTQRVHPNAIKPSTRQEAKIMLDRADIITDLIWVWINMISSKPTPNISSSNREETSEEKSSDTKLNPSSEWGFKKTSRQYSVVHSSWM